CESFGILMLRINEMFEVTISKSFSAAHLLAEIGGKCEELHGHNFKVEVTVGANQLTNEGVLIDFRLVKKWLKEILDQMDHQHLNELPFFKGQNPSSENIAYYVFHEMKIRVKEAGVRVFQVKVWESENSAVTYRED
ncbi:MAG: 6-carboxytetrahydropterin synthase QueD, partial [Deltaproteobacteria bacterium]|nr:6-carboxytetrahydropterin synthase QueD [Deltaproteobacteria bacterium]